MLFLLFLLRCFLKHPSIFIVPLIGIVDLFKLKNHQQIVLPIGLLIFFLSMVMASNFSEQTEEGIIPHEIAIALHIIIPLIMLLIRNRFKEKAN
ncbi:hypothetical protein [Neobacillus cucumis]|uniref:hypothetical protein n=1 Tax=Neobacillus cucumis TaxID=1740721 RepID=UPI001EF9B01E|nr:hypothetical protein [Neobacillus cucumis]